MHEIHDHRINLANDVLVVQTLDDPGPGGANHVYNIHGPAFSLTMTFQNGAIAEAGVNGITHEALIAIVLDRLRAFQTGPYACRENALAITKLEEAQHWLLHRTHKRMTRGVEGTMEV